MSFLKKLFGAPKNPNSYSYKLARAEELHGQTIRYVTERVDNNEDVIGRGGALTVHGDNFIVDSSGDRLFVCKIRDLDISWLMSGDGVIIRGPDLQMDCKERTITAHFVYYRK